MADVKITTLPNGPLVIEGVVQIVNAQGQPIPPAYPDKPKIALCRCGASTKKPFCDGTHSKIGFKSEP